jgi:hypothetical protein
VTALTVKEREGDLEVAGPAELALVEIRHGIFGEPPFYSYKELGMAYFASIPDSVLGMRKINVGHARHLAIDGEILLDSHGLSLDGDAFQGIDQPYETLLLRPFPVNAVPEALFRKSLSERIKVGLGDNVPSR